MELLGASGYTVHDIVHNIILGSAGGIFKASMDELASLGIDKDRLKLLTRKLHEHSIHWLHTIIRKRRLLENARLFRKSKMRNTDTAEAANNRRRKPPD